jgi:hypothetical protein
MTALFNNQTHLLFSPIWAINFYAGLSTMFCNLSKKESLTGRLFSAANEISRGGIFETGQAHQLKTASKNRNVPPGGCGTAIGRAIIIGDQLGRTNDSGINRQHRLTTGDIGGLALI